MAPKSSSGIKRSYSGNISRETTTTHDLGFGEFTRTSYTETTEGRRMLNAVQKAAVGTEITVSNPRGWGIPEEQIYRVTGTTHNKRLLPVNGNARSNLSWDNLDSVEIKDRATLLSVLSPLYENGSVSLERKPLTASERRDIKAERKLERQRRAAEKRQYRINFD